VELHVEHASHLHNHLYTVVYTVVLGTYVVVHIVVLGIYSSIIRRTRVPLLPAVRDNIRQHTSADVRIRQRMHPCCLQQRPTLVFAYTCSIRYMYLLLHSRNTPNILSNTAHILLHIYLLLQARACARISTTYT
jgi:hypothetical protein